ncbi:MAG: ABC-F family ATP-binding cassette domain-containing protein [Saprospiraceae bacterium]|nr:ABC-F family ATP-binding cassette domain-containing protein [Saprospiraceae bacterium]
MITASNILVKYGDRTLLNEVNLVVNVKDKIGLVGRNGAGKSTMLKILSSTISPTSGKVALPSNATMSYLHQDINIPLGKTIMEEALTAFERFHKMEAELAELDKQIQTRTDYESDSYMDLIQAFTDLTDQIQVMGGDSIEAETEKILKGLGFKQKDFNRQIGEFSGGWQMRVELAKMLLVKPDYLLLDEPTNHLDIESIVWLEKFLKNYHKSVIVISHDKQFLDNVTNRTVEISMGNVYDYKAPYTQYLALRLDRREKMQSAYENQQKVIAQKERTINRFMAKANKTKMAQSMKKQLDKMDKIELDVEDTSAMNLRFPPASRSGQIVVDALAVSKTYKDLQVLRSVDFRIERGERVAFVGQNGQGKTTLAKMLINDITASAGDIKLGHNVEVGYYAQNQSESLDSSITLLETMEMGCPPEKRTQLRNILGAFMFSGEDVDKKVSVLSGGERARLALACMLLRSFNLLLLDEPTNHLDIQSKEVLKKALMAYDGAMIVVSHDRDFLKGLTDKTVEFRDGKLHDYLGDVEFFLEKRDLDNMRDVEKTTKTKKIQEVEKTILPKIELSYDERKKLVRTVSNSEKKIERIESDIKKLNERLFDPAVAMSEEAASIGKDIKLKETELVRVMEEWEKAQEILDQAD